MAKQKDGRRNRYQFQAHLLLPEPASQEPAIGGVLALFAGAGARLQLTGTGPASGHRIRPGAPRWTRTTGVLPGPGLPQMNRGAHAVAALSGEPGIAAAPAPRASPGLLPVAASRRLSRASCRDASGLAVLMSTGRRAGLPGLSRPAAPAPPLARVVRITGPGRQIDIFSHRQLQRWGLPGIANTGG